MRFSLGFSPCPNDTFIFYAMVNGLIDTPLQYNVQMLDVEELNKRAFEAEINITKLSFNAYTFVQDQYQILESGSALGNGCGPLLISKTKIDIENIENQEIIIPGKYTTANLLCSIALPHAINKKEMLFSDIESYLVEHPDSIGLIIHENRFTYQEKGLFKIIDLGEHWEEKTKLPIPLGCIAIQRNIDTKTKAQVNRDIRHSIEYAYANVDETLLYAKQYAQEMDMDVMKKHIDLYVNAFTKDLGITGKQAVERLFLEISGINGTKFDLKNNFI